MARIRAIKPIIFFDEDLAELPIPVRYFFIGLWTQADREGKLEDRPKHLKAQIYPYDNFDVEKALSLLSGKFIIGYSVNGKKYLKINTFLKHQRPHHTEVKSEIPDNNGEITVNSTSLDGENPPVIKGLRVKGIGLRNGVKERDLFLPIFEELWSKYPNKDGKKHAIEHFYSSVKDEESVVLIRKALENYLSSDRVKNGFVKNGSTWFNGWKDWIDYVEPKKGGQNGKIEGRVTAPAGKYAGYDGKPEQN